ncbi:3-keto-disaccharide hydrolase [Pontiella sulfatireligans]|uniref:3-keto-alpha-glucoside-1,2-lyase/3-keto-2-hydroxy-glucal hydratase domain-containing protein n=1 Tax=Pontiella sulfatireligans TaxID=2750658 RepID=A0A6C2UJP6_9BACT|nr:DUF1080 domain-containing protein [Pontiella sulfatireligans]VGO20103.1 hypothetical protein SCARR_02163 [Pontiella sulfatireligans]
MAKSLMLHLAAGAVWAVSLNAGAAAWTPLLDQNLSQFEVWMGIPHTSVQGLSAGTETSEDCHKGVPMGLNADVKRVFSMTEDGGEPMLHVSGEIYGGLTTLAEYENYHLSFKIKWGEKKWAPRLDQLRDSGVLYHCHGEHGTFWGVWKSSLECQVQETDLGDFIQIAGPRAEIRTSKVEGTKRPRFDPASAAYSSGYISAFPEPDAPHGEWNHMEIYAVGDTSVHVVNGLIVMVVENARKKDGSPLIRGQIQIQSEAAECFYKDLQIRSITGFPDPIKSQLRLKPEAYFHRKGVL